MNLSKLKQKPYNILIGVLIIIIIYNATPIKNLFNTTQKPLFSIGSIFYNAGEGINNLWTGFTQGHSLQNKVKEQEKIISNLIVKNAKNTIDEIDLEDTELLSKLSEELNISTISAKVISYSKLSGEQIIYINKGKSSGVSNNLPVITNTGILVAKIIETSENSSIARIITNTNSVIATTILENNSMQSIVRGRLGLGLMMELIPQDTDIEIGNTVVSSILEENTPQGLIIGTVANIQYEEAALFKTAQIEPAISIGNISNVGIVIQK
jgi:rod shape-determining protein MreC